MVEETTEDIVDYLEAPDDLHGTYMKIRMQKTPTFLLLYMKLFSLIDIGRLMLPVEYVALREEADSLLNNENFYPSSRQLELTSNGYRLGTGSASTGLIHVHVSDLAKGIDEQKEQQAQALLPKLKEIEGKISKALVDAGILEVKKTSMEGILMDKVMMEMTEMASEEDDGVGS